jgi:RimJ/RimL family protein N-acetyltransferase/protein tyrosine phosphatase (PTP) superfamily phosphohydrolase (DUF442 family)
MSTEEIYNYRKVSDLLITGGQPTAEQLKSAADEGFRVVINLATQKSDHALEDEAGLVQSFGMEYHHIPVEWEQPTERDFAAFEQVMKQLPTGKTLIHCAANFRATAFYALYAFKNLGWSKAQAETFRASIWQGSDYPIWEKFIGQVKANLDAQGPVQLRDVLETDLPIFFEQQLDPDAARMAAFPSRSRDTFMVHWAKILADENVQTQTILFNGQVAGNIVSFEQDGKREVGYWLGKEFWDQGVATRALADFLGQVKVRPLYAYVAKHNLASRRVLEKCGFAFDSEDIEGLILKLV